MLNGLEDVLKADTAKSTKIDCTQSVEEYINKSDWRIFANANTGYSNAGLVNGLAGKVIANYWLDKVYSKKEGDAHRNGDYHIHDLDCLSGYCCGHDLQRLLNEGFNGVVGRVGSKAPKHFREALYQMANFIGILQAEWGGAQAFSSFDTYLAPYVFFDMYYGNLDQTDVQKAILNFIYNLNVPSRWGQCVPELYKCLKADGTWVSYKDLNVGDEIYVVDMETGHLKKDKITHLNLFDAPKKMHRYSNKQGGFNFEVTPNHRVIYKTGSNALKIKESAELLNYDMVGIPIAPWGKQSPETFMSNEYDIQDELLEFIAYIMTDGTITKQEGRQTRISWFKSPKRFGIERFEELCDILNISYSRRKDESSKFEGSFVYEYRLNVCETVNKVVELLNDTKHEVPEFFQYLSPRQCYIVLDAWVLMDGHFDGVHWKMQADNKKIQEMLASLSIRSGKAVSLTERLIGTNKNATIYTNIHKRQTRSCVINEVEASYEKVWCPTTETGTFVCMTDEGYVFLTGNSPFSNITIDWTIPADMSAQYPLRNDKNYFRTIYEDLLDEEKVKFNETVVIELKKRLEITEDISIDDLFDKVTYKLFQKEMNIINKAFYECLNKGDINGLPFTFPIPTVNITENFNWEGENVDLLFENAAKYGSSYFQNFIGSQYKRNENGELVLDDNAYKPSDVRSMCPLTGDTEILTLSGRGINNTQLYHLNEDEHQVLANGKWVKFKKINIGTGQKVYAVKLSNGLTVKMGENHLQPTQRGTVKCKDLIVGDLIPFNTDVITWSGETGSYLLGYAIGAYYGDGNKDSNGICYSLAVSDKDNETEEKLKTFWNSLGYKVTTNINDGVRKVRIGGNSFDLIARFISGDNANNKKMTSYSFSLTEEARNGIIDGYIATDGNRTRKRINTSSEQMVNNLITLFTLQGKKALLSYTDTRDTRLGDKPNYIVSYPERDSYGDYYKTIDNVLYYSITEINEIEQQHLYCIEVEDDSHVFTLANGMTTHNCRLQLDKRELRKRGGGLFGSDAQTGSIGVVTINMARLGYLYKGNFPLLKKKLIHLMELAKSTLEKKRSFINELYLRGLYPYTRRYLKGFNTFFSTIGVNGMNEMVRNFSNDEYDITSYEGQKMCIELLDLIRSKMSDYQEETGNLYNLEATPAEGTTYRFAKEDIKRFPDIIHAGTEKEPYYTNSSQLPVNFTDDPFEALDKQDELQCKYTGGTVLHLYMTERLSNATACKNLIKKVLTNYRLPYISITPTYSTCPIHGYIPGNHEFCPKCDQIILEEYAKEIDFNE